MRGNLQKKGIKIMRLVLYHVVNKDTNKSVYVDCRKPKAVEFLQALAAQEQFELRYKWGECLIWLSRGSK